MSMSPHDKPIQRYFTAEDVLDALHKAVADKGEDYLYEPIRVGAGIFKCIYVEQVEANDEIVIRPSCLVGHALHYLGVPLESMGLNLYVSALLNVLKKQGYIFDKKAELVLVVAQATQDRAMKLKASNDYHINPESATWGAAVKRAEEISQADGIIEV
jgi:hypothetical protein